jgi:hypothetical protein
MTSIRRIRYHLTKGGWVRGAESDSGIADCDDPRPDDTVVTYEQHSSPTEHSALIHAFYELWRKKGTTDADVRRLHLQYSDRPFRK